jgi:hypothetical protein
MDLDQILSADFTGNTVTVASIHVKDANNNDISASIVGGSSSITSASSGTASSNTSPSTAGSADTVNFISTAKIVRTVIGFQDSLIASQWSMKLFSLVCKNQVMQVTDKLAILIVDKSDMSKVKEILQKKVIPILEASRKAYDVIREYRL